MFTFKSIVKIPIDMRSPLADQGQYLMGWALNIKLLFPRIKS